MNSWTRATRARHEEADATSSMQRADGHSGSLSAAESLVVVRQAGRHGRPTLAVIKDEILMRKVTRLYCCELSQESGDKPPQRWSCAPASSPALWHPLAQEDGACGELGQAGCHRNGPARFAAPCSAAPWTPRADWARGQVRTAYAAGAPMGANSGWRRAAPMASESLSPASQRTFSHLIRDLAAVARLLWRPAQPPPEQKDITDQGKPLRAEPVPPLLAAGNTR